MPEWPLPTHVHLYPDRERGWVAICDTCEGGYSGPNAETALARLLLAVVPGLAERISEDGAPASDAPALSWMQAYVPPKHVPREQYAAVRDLD